jgi:hypothetical protein
VQLAAKRVERQTKSFEREGAEEIAVAGLSKDHVSAADEVFETKKGNAFSTGDS